MITIKAKVFITVILATILIIISALIFDLNMIQMTRIFEAVLLLNILEKVYEINNKEIEVRVLDATDNKVEKCGDDSFDK